MQSEMEELGGKLISISPEVLDSSKREDVKDAESLITSDINNKFAKELGLVFKVREEIQAQYREWGIDLEKSQKNTNGELPMPATIITDENGVVIHVFVSTDYTERYEPEDILKVLSK